MPTGFTAKVIQRDDVLFAEFARDCARYFGANITMRDEPSDAPIKPYEPSDYSLKAGKEAVALVQQLEAMNENERLAYGEARKRENVDLYLRMIEDARIAVARCNAMLAKVVAWTPPTPDHEGMKKFMLEQLQETKRFDGGDWSKELEAAREKPPSDYFSAALAAARRMVVYHRDEYAKEVERVTARNKWNADLFASLK